MKGGVMTKGTALLIVGHPGHELMVHGWLESATPLVLVLTDGSGHAGVPRLASTAALITRAGATAGPVFGRLTDVALYRAILDHNEAVFADLVAEMAGIIVDRHISVVVGDDAEGFNPTHDVCRLLIDAAVRRARVLSGRPVANFAFKLVEGVENVQRSSDTPPTLFGLSDEALARKMAAAAGYPEMAFEVDAARKRLGDDAFRVESFRQVRDGEIWAPAGDGPAYYERHGRQRVEEGLYPEVIYYEQHIRPLADLLHERSLREAS